MQRLEIASLQGEPPWELLMLADPSRERIQAYLANGMCYQASLDGEIIGAFVLVAKSLDLVELINIAICERFHGQGLGKELLQAAISIARGKGFQELEVGTGNSSLSQLGLYQKAGFRIVGIDKDFFLRNYDTEIIENGIKCLDMLRLTMRL
jgi:ribosomal protein S18 acetylase RimI-like enzyme